MLNGEVQTKVVNSAILFLIVLPEIYLLIECMKWLTCSYSIMGNRSCIFRPGERH